MFCRTIFSTPAWNATESMIGSSAAGIIQFIYQIIRMLPRESHSKFKKVHFKQPTINQNVHKDHECFLQRTEVL